MTLYDAITNRYVFKLEVDGEVKELTRGQLTAYVQGPDADLRARAYQELYRVYGGDAPILGQMYQTRARDWHNENIGLRKFSSAMSVRNLANDVPDEAVNALLDVTRKNAKVFQRYFKIKAKLLGVDKLRRFDIYAPVAKSDKKFDYNDATKMVFDSFRSFDPQIAEMAQRVFDQEHVDSEVRKGKRDGAFCWSVLPDMTPYVLLNLFPLTQRSMKSMKRFAVIAPQMKELQTKYGSDREKLQEEMMKLYRQKGMNPLSAMGGGCVPILVQIPFMIALYFALQTSIELRHAPFALWINDLSAAEDFFAIAGLPIRVLPLLMGGSMLLQQRLTPAPNADPQQKQMMTLMSVAFTFMFYQFPSGLVLYWFVSNLLGIAQQLYVNRTPTPTAPAT